MPRRTRRKGAAEQGKKTEARRQPGPDPKWELVRNRQGGEAHREGRRCGGTRRAPAMQPKSIKGSESMVSTMYVSKNDGKFSVSCAISLNQSFTVTERRAVQQAKKYK